MYSYGPLHMAVQKQDDQHEHTFSSYVRIRDVVLKTYLERWTIGRCGERGSGISVLPARHDDDDEVDFSQTLDHKYRILSNKDCPLNFCPRMNKIVFLNFTNFQKSAFTYMSVCWLVLIAYPLVLIYFIPRGLGIINLYLHFSCCFSEELFAHSYMISSILI